MPRTKNSPDICYKYVYVCVCARESTRNILDLRGPPSKPNNTNSTKTNLGAVGGVVIAAEVEVLRLDRAQVRVGEELERPRADVRGREGLAVVDLLCRGRIG